MRRAIEQAAADPSPAAGRRDNLILGAVFVTLAVVALIAYGYHQLRFSLEQRQAAVALTHGDPDRGAVAIGQYGCGGCHAIPGITGANGRVGPDLTDIARQIYVAGVLTNTPEHLIAFIADPKSADPKTAMPLTGISAAEARDVAAYLYAIPD
jgi:cytochrome c2